MTTDTHPKALSASVGDATITWVAKGSGMIEPNMATMLAYIFTDAALDAPTLDTHAARAPWTSRSTCSAWTATRARPTPARSSPTGCAGAVDAAALRGGAHRRLRPHDGDAGARRRGREQLLRVRVRGAATTPRRARDREVAGELAARQDDGRTAPIPNVGRLLDGGRQVRRTARIRPAQHRRLDQRLPVVREGQRLDFDDAVVRAALGVDTVDLEVSLGVGDGEATAWGCDLTQGYVDENAAYYCS